MTWWDGQCPLEYADEPASAFPQLEWAPCPDQAEGCEILVKNWPTLSPTAIAPPTVQRVEDGYSIVVPVKFPEFEVRMALTNAEGKATFVYRTPPNSGCLPIVPTVTRDGHYMGVQEVRTDGSVYSKYVFQPDEEPVENAGIIPTTIVSQDQTAREDLFALQGDFGGSAWIFDRSKGRGFETPAGRGATLPHLAEDAAFLLLFDAQSRPEGWVWDRDAEAYDQLLDRSPNFVVELKADDEEIVWIEAAPPPEGSTSWPAGTLYRSAFTTEPSAIDPILVRPMPRVGMAPLSAIGGGYYAVYAFETERIQVVRLSDGWLWSFPRPRDEFDAAFESVVFIDEAYVFMKTNTNIYRQRLDALGPGEAPP